MYSQQQLLAGSTAGSLKPNKLSSLVHWLDAQTLSTMYTDSLETTPVLSSGDFVGAWKDRSLSALDVVQAAASSPNKRPQYLSGGIGTGLPGVNFTAASTKYLAAASCPAQFQSGAGEVWAVIRQTNGTTGPQGAVYSLGKSSSGGDVCEFTFLSVSGPHYVQDCAIVGSVGPTNNDARGTTDHANGTAYLVRYASNNGQYVLETNGAADAYSMAGGSNNGAWTNKVSAPNNVSVGVLQFSNGFFSYADFVIGELLVFNAALTTGQANGIRRYLHQRWGFSF